MSIPWQHRDGDGNLIPDHLWVEQLEEHVTVGMRVDEKGDYAIEFIVGVSGAHRTLPEVEDFIRRCARLLELEPVASE